MPKRLRRARRPARLLDRILSTPELAHVVPQLQPEVLHRLIQHCGLQDCGELLALVTPDQLTRLFDLDLWRPSASGLDEQFDADRFGTWLEVMVDAGVSSAAATLAAMDVNLLAAGLVEHVRVFDYAAVAPFMTIDGDVAPGAPFAEGVRAEIGGYVVVAKRVEFWDAITVVLNGLGDAHSDAFQHVMRQCCRLSSSRPEIDGLDDRLTTNEQAMFDVALDREERGDTQGYVTPAQARAFLQMARRIDLRDTAAPPRDSVTRAYFRDVEARVTTATDTEAREPQPKDALRPVQQGSADAVSAIVDLLQDAGVLPRATRALLAAAQPTTERQAPRVRALLEFVHDRDPDAYATRNAELAYLANVIAAGVTIQSRALRTEEASEAVLAVCNLGLENWPGRWRPESRPEELLIHHDLVVVFQVGWTVLYEDVCIFAADQLVGVLRSIHSIDHHVQEAIETLRTTLTRHSRAGAPWGARGALDVIAILDTPAWAALLGLIDQLPTMHAALGATMAGSTRQIDAAAFEFISENAQIQQVRDFMQVLPGRLR